MQPFSLSFMKSHHELIFHHSFGLLGVVHVADGVSLLDVL